MPQNTISVIIPYFEASNTIGRALESALAQTVRPLEIIVIDDGSREDATGVLKEFGSNVTLIRKPNGGAASARNVGIEQARGEWIAFLDADDYWEPSKLERQLIVSKDVAVVGCRWFTETPGAPRREGPVQDASLFGRMLKARGSRAFAVAMNLSTSVVLVRRAVLGDRRFDSDLETAEDRDLWIRLAASTSVYLVQDPLSTYVQREGSLSNIGPDRDCVNMLRVVRRYATLLGPKETRIQEAVVYQHWAGCHLAGGKPRSAISPAARRLTIQPTSAQAWWIMAKALGQSILS